MARRSRRKSRKSARRAKRVHRNKGAAVARRRSHRRRRSTAVVHTNARRHVRRFRRNPAGMGGIVKSLTKGAKCGLFITLGEASSVAVPNLVGLPTTGLLGYAARLGVGTVIGVFGRGVLGAENAEYFIGGVFAGVYRQLIRQFQVPILAPALAGYPGPVALRGYPPKRPAIAPAGMRTGRTNRDAINAAGNLF